ncbi:transglycosylase SLT domain-containing protein [Azospirillum tabaci]|uniref:transglycosylase SLT domain-containing protein n=1 Tax=Azospirillum tabaci TaxID=2752310 RepID=UPI0016614E10|nr:transglycosylase SLT domain-containing protein [Azospirillum tabaci]
MAQEQVESLVVGYEDHASAGAAAAAAAIKRVGDEAVVTEERVRRVAKSGEQLGRQYGEVERLTAKVAAVTQKFRRDLDDLEASEKDAAEKARLRANILAQQEIAVQKATTAHERWVAGMRAAESASTAQAAGAAAATATAKSWAGAMAQVYETATTASTGVNGTARALQALNADLRSGRATFAEWAAGAKALESALRGISAAQKAINDNTGVSRSPVNTAAIGELRYATTGKGASTGTTLALVTGDAEASARRLKDLEAAFGAVDAELERYREDLGLVDVAQKRYQAGLAELEATVRRAGLAEEEGAALLQAYAAAHDPAVAAAKRLADEEKAALARMSADWDAAVRDREATAAMIIADEQATARAAAQTAAENAKLAASYRAVMAAVDPAAAAQQRYDAALEDLRAGAAAAGKSVEELAADEEWLAAALSPAALAAKKQETELRSLVGSLDRTFGAEERLTKQQRLLDRAMTDGIGGIRLTREQHEALSNTLREQHAIATRTATSTKLAAHESLNLGYQLQDFVVQVGSGQGVLTPLLQQAPQAVGAVGGLSRAMALLTSSTALSAMGIGSLVLGFGLVIGRAIIIQDELRQFNALLRATGDQAGMTAEQLHGVVDSMMGAGASRQDARVVAQTIARSRKLVGEEIAKEVGALSIDMGVVFGGTAEAGKMLTGWLTTGTKGLRELAAETQALTLEQYESARSALEQGDRQQALGIVIGALKAQYAGLHRESLSPAAAAMEDLTHAYNELMNTAAQHPIVVTVQVVGADFLRGISNFIKDPLNFEFPTPFGGRETLDYEFPTPFGVGNWLRSRRPNPTLSEGAITGNTPALPAAPAGTPVPGRKPTSQGGMPLEEALVLSDLTKANDKLLVAMQKVGAERVIETARVQAEIAALNAGKSEKAAELEGAQAARMARAQLTQAVTDTNRATVAEIAGAQLMARAYGSSSAAVREASLHQKALAEVARGTIEPYDAIVDRLRRVDDAQRKVQAAQFDATLRQQTEDAARLAAAWEKGAGAVREVTLANEVLAEARKRGLDPTRDAAEIRGIGEAVLARDMAQRAAQFGQLADEQRRAVEAANAEYALLGQSNAARGQQIAMLRAANDLRAKGADLTDAGTQAYIKQAGELARVNSILQDAAQTAADIANPIGTAFEDVLVGAQEAGDAFKALGEDLQRIFVRQTFTKPFETLVSGELTKLMAGRVAVANDNTPRAAADAGLLDRIVGQVNGGLGSTANNAMWVRVAAGAAGAAALDATSMATQGLTGPVPVPVAVKDAGDLEGVIQTASVKYGVDANTIKALIQQESTWNPAAVNPRSGAAGLMQIMPANWSAYGITNPFDPAQNVDAGTRIFREHLDRAGGDLERALSTFGGFITKSSDGYVASVKANKAAYDQAGAATVAFVGAQTQAASVASVFTATQRATIDAALGNQKATVEATDKQDALSDGLDHFRESLRAEAKSRDEGTRATQQLAEAQQTAAAGMVGGTQAALGGIMSLLGGITGSGAVSVGGSVVSAGGPQGIASALGSVWNGLSGGSFGDSSLSGVKSWLNSTAWGGNVASKTAPVAKAGNGTLAGGEGAQTGMGTAPATPAVSWGNVVGGGMTAVGGAMQMSRAQNAGQSIGGAAQMAGGVMMMIPGLQVVGGLVALGGTLLSAFSDGNSRGDPYSVTNLSMKGGRFTRGSFDADNGGDPAKWNSAVGQIATKLNGLMDTYGLIAGDLSTIVVGERNATPEQAMLQALRSMKSDNADIAWVLAHAVGDDIDAAVKAIDFASKFRDTVALWNSGMSSIVASTHQGTAAANAFGKSILEFLKGTESTYDVAALTAKVGGKTGNAALDKLLAGLPGYATGTPSAKSGWAVVGEEGPELVKLAGGERIWNAQESARMLAGLGQGRDTELVHVRPDELAWMHKTLGGGRINPVTGLPMFLEGETGGVSDTGSGGVGGMGGNSEGFGGHTDRDGNFTASENSGGIAGAISSLSTAIGSLSRSVASALGLEAKETAVLGGMVGITGIAAIGGIRGFAEAMGKGLASVTGPGEAPAVAGPGDPGLSPTGGDFAAAEAVLTKLLDAIKDDPTGAVASGVMGGLEAGSTGYTVAQIAGGSSDAYLAGVRGQGGEAKVAALAEDLDAAVQSIAAAGVAIPDVLQQALEKTNAYATSLGITPASQKRETTERLFNSALGEHGLSTERYGEVMGVVQSLADGTFSAVGKDFQALADDMVKSMAAMSSAGMQVPPALQAAEKRMLALVAAKARIDAEVAGVTDTATDYQKKVAQAQGYWSTESADLVKAMQAVGYEGDVLSQKLGEGLKNAIANVNKEAAKVYNSDLNAASGKDYLNQLQGIRDWFDKNGPDVNKATGDNDAANRMYGARADAVLKDLSIDQLNTVISTTADDTMRSWAQTYLTQARSVFTTDNDLRIQKAKADLLSVQDPEHAKAAQHAYELRALDIEQSRELAKYTDEDTKAKIRNAHAIEKQILVEKQAAEEREKLLSTGSSVRSWLDQKNATAGTSVTPQAARDAAQAQFARDLALARGGDVDAYGRLTGAADRLLSTQEALTASGTETQTMRAWVMSSLENLPGTKSYDQQMLEELKKLGGSVNVAVELTTVRVITEQLNALSDTDKAKLVQSQVVLRTVEERIGRFLTDAELGRLVDNALVTRDVQQTLGRDLTDAERAALVGGGNVLRTVEQLMGRTLTATEVSSLVQAGAVTRSVEQSIGRDLTAAERASLISGGDVGLVIAQSLGRNLTDAERAALVQAGTVSRTIEQAIGRSLTPAETASLVSAGAVTRDIGQYLARDLSPPEIAALVVGGSVERMVAQQLGRDLTVDERAGLVTAATVIRSVEQQLGRALTPAEQAAIVLPGSVQRTIGQTIDPATGAVLIASGTVTRKVTQDVTETVTSAAMRDLTQGFQVIQLQATSVIINKLDAIGKLVYEAGLNTVRAITGNWQWGSNVSSSGPTVLTTREATYLARYADLADAWAADPSFDPSKHWEMYGQYENGRYFSVGGRVDGPGTETSDDVAAWLSRDEFVIQARAARAAGYDVMEALNAGNLIAAADMLTARVRNDDGPRFADGGRVGYEAGGFTPPANDLWAPDITPIRRQDYAPQPGRSGGDDRAVAELRLLRQAIERLERRLERNEGMDQEQRAAIAQEMARLLDRVADAAETTAQKVSERQG